VRPLKRNDQKSTVETGQKPESKLHQQTLSLRDSAAPLQQRVATGFFNGIGRMQSSDRPSIQTRCRGFALKMRSVAHHLPPFGIGLAGAGRGTRTLTVFLPADFESKKLVVGSG
jgi:hypothetical protein